MALRDRRHTQVRRCVAESSRQDLVAALAGLDRLLRQSDGRPGFGDVEFDKFDRLHGLSFEARRLVTAIERRAAPGKRKKGVKDG